MCSQPFTNTMITLSSLPESPKPLTTTALLFPSFLRIQSIPHSPSALSAFATAYLKARSLHPAHAGLSDTQKKALTRDESLADELPTPEPITTPTILICGHGGRDQRCGILGPILEKQFKFELERRGIKGEVGLISHIGGHKYAGNVIIYLPPGASGEEGGDVRSLKGTGVWYGRVEAKHVEGIVEETIVKGRVIQDMFRGGITREGANLGRMLEEQMKKESGEDGGLKLKPRARG